MIVRFIVATILLLVNASAFSDGDPTFTRWVERLKADAIAEGISEAVVEDAVDSAKFLPRVIELDRSQPEFINTFFNYIYKRVTSDRVAEGRAKLQQHAELLEKVEAHYGVPKNILVAFWGLETNYGSNKGSHALPSALLTLAYEGRRAAFFRKQLIDMMRIVDAGHKPMGEMKGSWAGAMGHMQFMPSTYLDYSIDADGDGRNDIWDSLPDAFSSAANYLTGVGWQPGQPVALEVQLPAGFEYYQAQIGIRKHTKLWSQEGVRLADGQALPQIDNTAILLPQGWRGPAFLVTSNFDVVMKWNRSINYALSVSHLADQLTTSKPIVNGLNVNDTAITFDQAWALQNKLNQLGYDSGKPDGYPGPKTKEAIRNYQLKNHLPADGYPSLDIYNQLMAQ